MRTWLPIHWARRRQEFRNNNIRFNSFHWKAKGSARVDQLKCHRKHKRSLFSSLGAFRSIASWIKQHAKRQFRYEHRFVWTSKLKCGGRFGVGILGDGESYLRIICAFIDCVSRTCHWANSEQNPLCYILSRFIPSGQLMPSHRPCFIDLISHERYRVKLEMWRACVARNWYGWCKKSCWSIAFVAAYPLTKRRENRRCVQRINVNICELNVSHRVV